MVLPLPLLDVRAGRDAGRHEPRLCGLCGAGLADQGQGPRHPERDRQDQGLPARHVGAVQGGGHGQQQHGYVGRVGPLPQRRQGSGVHGRAPARRPRHQEHVHAARRQRQRGDRTVRVRPRHHATERAGSLHRRHADLPVLRRAAAAAGAHPGLLRDSTSDRLCPELPPCRHDTLRRDARKLRRRGARHSLSQRDLEPQWQHRRRCSIEQMMSSVVVI
mmetsp:Transcript_6670/g.17921  ORF Transcript_6670/g.17921 Transcript_6670/m.17921 type:complete len:218 (-) Transcript_6670:4-657(-)